MEIGRSGFDPLTQHLHNLRVSKPSGARPISNVIKTLINALSKNPHISYVILFPRRQPLRMKFTEVQLFDSANPTAQVCTVKEYVLCTY